MTRDRAVVENVFVAYAHFLDIDAVANALKNTVEVAVEETTCEVAMIAITLSILSFLMAVAISICGCRRRIMQVGNL